MKYSIGFDFSDSLALVSAISQKQNYKYSRETFTHVNIVSWFISAITVLI